MFEVVGALAGFELFEDDLEGIANGVEGSRAIRRSSFLSLAKTCSIGLKSGLYGGR